MNDTSRVVLVTGSARRIGAGIVRDLARHGWTVAIHHHRSAAEAGRLAAEIEAAGAGARLRGGSAQRGGNGGPGGSRRRRARARSMR